MGAPLASLAAPDFQKAQAASTDFIDRLPKLLRPAAKKAGHPLAPHRQKPVRGLRQVRPKAAPSTPSRIQGGRAKIDYKTASAAFCCHEMCPKHVVDIKRLGLFRF